MRFTRSQGKKRKETAKTKHRIPEMGPRLAKHSKKHISDRADKERLQEFNRRKKGWREAGILRAIADGEIKNSGEIEQDASEEEAQELIDGLFYIDRGGSAV